MSLFCDGCKRVFRIIKIVFLVEIITVNIVVIIYLLQRLKSVIYNIVWIKNIIFFCEIFAFLIVGGVVVFNLISLQLLLGLLNIFLVLVNFLLGGVYYHGFLFDI